MEGLIPPSALNMDSDNLAKSWKAWKEEFTLYLELAMPEAEETTRVKLFYYLIGEKGRELCNTLRGEDTEARTTVKKMIEMLDEHCSPKVNETVETYRFFVRNQGQDESIEKYVTDLKSLASTCNFGQIKESLIRDRIVCGTNNAVLRERLLREDKLTLDKCVQLCRATELSRENRQTLEGRAVEEVHVIRKYASKDRDNEISCKFCGKRHERNKKKCPAFGKKCMKCGRDNHFAAMCKTRAETRKQRKPVHAVTELDSETYEDILTVTENTRTVHQVNDSLKTKQLYAGMLIANKLVKFQIDCGTSCNIIPVHLLNPDTQLEQTEKVLVMYNKTELHPIGKCKIKVRNPRNQKLYRLEFQVVDQKCGIPLLGRNASEGMKLIRVQYENILAIDSIVKKEESEGGQWTLEEIMTEFEDVFTGDGCLQGEYVIEIDKTVEPVKLPKRRVPVAMMKPLKEELADLERRQIIAPVECSTDWISSMVAVQKPSGKLRICIDPKPLNRALKRSHFPLPTIDDILPDLSKTKVFTVCDVKQGFWHVKLEEESSYLTTFSTPFDRFTWLRMPMGISPAPEIFQRKLMQALEGLPDNGPQYTSQEFRQFSQRWEFEHRTSSPGYPQSNGKAESAVKMAKRIMKKAKASGRDPYLAILDHRNTPSQGLNTSPVQRLFSRRTRTLLPITDNLLKPEIQQNTQGLRNNQHRQIKYYNRTAKDLQPLKQGDRVRVQPFEPQTVWKPATVIKPVDHRSYEIKLENGGVLRRNRRHLRKENRTTPVTVPRHTHAECQQRVVTRFGRAIVRPCYLRDYTT
ncbi:hypothetical protein MHYP_G00004650 [Metynnis hypsauchen]